MIWFAQTLYRKKKCSSPKVKWEKGSRVFDGLGCYMWTPVLRVGDETSVIIN